MIRYIFKIFLGILAIIGFLWMFGLLSWGSWLTVDDLVKDYNAKFTSTRYSCDYGSRDLYNALDQTMQLEELSIVAIKIEERGGHAIVVYKENGNRYVLTTWTDDNQKYYIKKLDYNKKSLHEIYDSLIKGYRFVKVYHKGFGWIVKSRQQVMNECGFQPDKTSDIWQSTGKDYRDMNSFNDKHSLREENVCY